MSDEPARTVSKESLPPRVAMLVGAPPPLHGKTIPLSAGPGTPGRLAIPGVGTFLWCGTAKPGEEIYVYEKGSGDG